MAPAAGGLGDGRVEQVRANRDLRDDGKARDQQRGHQRAAADTGQPDKEAHAEASSGQRQELCHPTEVPHCPDGSPMAFAGIYIPVSGTRWNYFGTQISMRTGIPTERSKIAASWARRWNSARSAGESPRSEQSPRASNSRSSTKTLVPTAVAPACAPGITPPATVAPSTALTSTKLPGAGRSAKRSSDVGRPRRVWQWAMSLAPQACGGADSNVSKLISAETLMLVTGARSVAVRSR